MKPSKDEEFNICVTPVSRANICINALLTIKYVSDGLSDEKCTNFWTNNVKNDFKKSEAKILHSESLI